MKRFTDTEKWRDPWFRKLSSPAKQLWCYLLDQCDKIGLVEIDLTLASFDCGQQITEAHLAELGSRIESCASGKHFIPKFINFQYGRLTPSCNPHKPIIELVSIHGLIQEGLLYHYHNVQQNRVTTTLPTTLPTVGTLPCRVQDKTRQEEDKNGKEKEKEEVLTVLKSDIFKNMREDLENGTGVEPCKPFDLPLPDKRFKDNGSSIQSLRSRLCQMFCRQEDARWSYEEEALLVQIAKRPGWSGEMAEIEAWRPVAKFFPQSVVKVLGGWTNALDRARGANNKPACEKTLVEKEIERLLR